VEAVNDVRAAVGDTVRVFFRPYTYIKGALMVYGIPALALIVGAVLGKEYLSRFFPGSDPDMVSALTGFGLLIATFLIVKIASKRIEGKTEYVPIVGEIIEKSGCA
jgi:sigma-E factor negative regulatory protein RseC